MPADEMSRKASRPRFRGLYTARLLIELVIIALNTRLFLRLFKTLSLYFLPPSGAGKRLRHLHAS